MTKTVSGRSDFAKLWVVLTTIAAPITSRLTLHESFSHPRYPGNPWLIPLGCEGGDDLFEARIAAQWIPIGLQRQLTITHGARRLDRDG
jgi:hypothetical protein